MLMMTITQVSKQPLEVYEAGATSVYSSLQCCFISFNHMHSLKSLKSKMMSGSFGSVESKTTVLSKVKPAFVSAPSTTALHCCFTHSGRGAKALPSAFIVALMNGDAGEASRCQTCSA